MFLSAIVTEVPVVTVEHEKMLENMSLKPFDVKIRICKDVNKTFPNLIYFNKNLIRYFET